MDSRLLGWEHITSGLDKDEIPDPKKLCYCGYSCPDNCKFKTASMKDDPILKKEAYDQWQIKDRYNIEFKAEDIYCFGCKNSEKAEGVVLVNCPVRKCAIEKDLECCIECDELTACSMELWKRFPDFKNAVIEMQNRYINTKI